MWRMSSRRPGVPGLVASALRWTEVPPSMRYVPLPSPFRGSDPGAQFGAEQGRVATGGLPGRGYGWSLAALTERGDKLGMTGQGDSPQASAQRFYRFQGSRIMGFFNPGHGKRLKIPESQEGLRICVAI